MMTRARKIVRLAAEEAVLATTAHLIRMDGLGAFSAIADRLAEETREAATELGMTEDEHDAQLARLLVWEIS